MTGDQRSDDRATNGLARPSRDSTPAYVRLTGWDSRTCCENPSAFDADDEANRGQAARDESAGMGRRLLVALLVFLGLGGVGLVLALAFEIVVPPMMWLACVGFLIFGVVAAGSGETPRARSPRLGDGDGARPIGCCPGPRPLGNDRPGR